MLHGIYYIKAKNKALKLFTGLTTSDLYILDVLYKQNIPCHYKRLHDLLCSEGIIMSFRMFNEGLHRSVDNKLITRQQVAGNVLYTITVDGKRLLYNFAQELDRIVKDQIMKYGNGFDE